MWYAGNEIIFEDFDKGNPGNKHCIFKIEVEGKQCFINYSDLGINYDVGNAPTFKMHCKERKEDIFPFTPISFYDWDRYFENESKIKYKADGFISFRQRPYAGAKERRLEVQQILAKEDIRISIIKQEEYFKEVGKILVTVCVPGANNSMLDRGQLQYMALGACTISPYVPEVMSFGGIIDQWAHYIPCTDDYSDLLEKIEWCRTHRERCIEIGKNAKEMFQRTCTPKAVNRWIKECLEV